MHKGNNQLVSKGCIKKLLVETVADRRQLSLMIFHFCTATVLTFLKNALKLLEDKEVGIPNYGRTEAQIWPLG